MSAVQQETVLALARKATDHLAAHGIDNARLDAELLLASALGMSRLELYLQHDRPLTEAELETYRTSIRRRMRREPLQYILGDAHFRELVLKVDRRVLIPRPETEVFGGVHGDTLLNMVVDKALGHLTPTGLLALEVGIDQAQRIAARATAAGFVSTRVVKDYTGRERIVLATNH